MSVEIKVKGYTAQVNNGIWRSDDTGFAKVLRFYKTKDIIPYTPWPDYTIAQMAAKALGGKIIEATDPPEYVAGRVY